MSALAYNTSAHFTLAVEKFTGVILEGNCSVTDNWFVNQTTSLNMCTLI
jgi:hypothetical protein